MAASTSPPAARPPLHTILPPLILGTATFNTQYVPDPRAMPYRDIVARAISLGITAFDTSPYYGPSEELVGDALASLDQDKHPRSSYRIITKAGRIGSYEFDYSPAWIRYSVLRSLRRLRTPYLDLVYTHDVEFVSPQEVLAAVRELRRLRDEDGVIRYVGISGFPVDTLCELAEMVLRETGEPLDAVMSYGNFTLQNRRLGLPLVLPDYHEQEGEEGKKASPLARLKEAGVSVVPNASMLGMGLLTSRGIPADSEPSEAPTQEQPAMLAKWHPSPPALRVVCKRLAELASAAGERLESVALRWSLSEWAWIGAVAGVGVDYEHASRSNNKLGVSVCGVSSIAELEETVAEWRGALSAIGLVKDTGDEKEARARQEKVMRLVREQLWPALGSWLDHAWDSPKKGYVNTRPEAERGVVPDDGIIAEYEEVKRSRQAAHTGAGPS
ncbi:Aldo/keto reductase [Canariomyces notabilis]|uniref:Aldo/keto reductase n=1 Tax=Canariomyces notabilis TaxID=2074819 RepID=A0AAN6TEM3_9PEZI|nr:Aldo/keto reductase [Canariomyces arenarius]